MRGVVTLLLLAAVLASVQPPDAEAVPNQRGGCYYGTQVRYSLQAPNALKPVARAAINQWEFPRWPYSGNSLIDVVETTTNVEVAVKIVDNVVDENGVPQPSIPGLFLCNQDLVQVKILNDDDVVKVLTAHEFGHALRLKHTGQHDSHDYVKPYMSTCAGTDLNFAQDDYSNLIFHHHSSNTGPINANFGAERADWWYWTSHNTAQTIYTNQAGVFSGKRSFGFKPNGSNHWLKNVATFVDNASNRKVRLQGNFRVLQSGTSGVFRLTYHNLQVDYGNNPCGGGQYINGYDLNNKTGVAWHVGADMIALPNGTNWTNLTSGDYTYPGEGTVAEVIVTSSIKKNNIYQWVYFDNAGVYDR